MFNDEESRQADVQYEILKPFPNTSYVKGQILDAYFTMTGRVTLGIFVGIRSPREWKSLEQEEVEKLIENKYIRQLEKYERN